MTELSAGFAIVINSGTLIEDDQGYHINTEDGSVFVPTVIINNTDSIKLREQLVDIVHRLILLAVDREELNETIKNLSEENNERD